MTDSPLVSILVPNYNYGRYLGDCLESALNQTYDNLQVVFVDNHSSDGSYDIAMDFRARYGDRIRVYRNDENVGGSRNCLRARSWMDPRTEFLIYLSSDDLFHPALVERSMRVMTEYASVGFVLCHRNAIDEEGRVTAELPFYNCDCVIPSTEQMEVFMMAGVGVSTQCFRRKRAEGASPRRGYHFDIAGDWYYNFVLACVSDVGYLKDPLCTYRTHRTNVTTAAIKNLMNSVEHVLMLHAFADIARRFERPSVVRRLEPALGKLGTMCLRYCAQLLRENDVLTATRYLHLAPVLRADIRADRDWKALWRITRLEPTERAKALAEFEAARPQQRMVSYDPPEGSTRL